MRRDVSCPYKRKSEERSRPSVPLGTREWLCHEDSRKRELDGADCFAFEEFGVGSEAEGFQHVGLHSFCEGIDLVDTEVLGADEIPQLPLSRRSLDNPQNGIRDFLSIAGRGGKRAVDLRRELLGRAIRNGATLVGSRHGIAKNRSLILTGLENHGFNSLRGKFVAIGLGQRLECKFAGAIETRRRKNHAAGAAADVYEHAAALAPHVRKHGAIYANGPE